MLEQILLATDGSAPAERAAAFAASLAGRYGAKVTVRHAFTPMPGHLGEPNYTGHYTRRSKKRIPWSPTSPSGCAR